MGSKGFVACIGFIGSRGRARLYMCIGFIGITLRLPRTRRCEAQHEETFEQQMLHSLQP